ncbi:TPA: hypothetical protein DIC38_03555 [Candidatus Nomurabacteria bacterium]|nr:hypothetical protein [Candidatus Nomurabacteria bacterium]
MLSFQVWRIKNNKVIITKENENFESKISFRHLEKIMLYLAKHIIQWIVLVLVKYWFIFITKSKKFIDDKIPKIKKMLGRDNEEGSVNLKRNSFVRRAILESKVKIKKMKEKIQEEI